jgi:hypothetical protein
MSVKGDNYYNNKCRIVWNIFLQLATWFIIIWCAVLGSYRGNLHWAEITSLVIVYLVYVLYFFTYRSFFYLLHNYDKKNILDDHMKNLFYEPPEIEFYIQCYHYEKRTTHTKNGTKTRTVKVVTYSETEKFIFYTWRDISGVFTLKTSDAKKNHKPFIQLNLNLNIDFADEISISDFYKQKELQVSNNRHRDTHISQSEKRILKGFDNYNLVRVSDEGGFFISKYWYIIFTIVPIVLLYDWYFISVCIQQEFEIKKILSTRYDLNSGENNVKYEQNVPRIIKKDSHIIYDVPPLPILKNPTLPNEEELIQAKVFVGNFAKKPSEYENNNINSIKNDIQIDKGKIDNLNQFNKQNLEEPMKSYESAEAIIHFEYNKEKYNKINNNYPGYDDIKESK